MSSKIDIVKVLQKLEIAYPGYKTENNEQVVDLWFETLGGYTSKTIGFAADMIIATSKYFPSLNDFLKAIQEIDKPITIDPEYAKLLKRRRELEEDLYSGNNDPEAWENLASEFEKLDKPHAAERCRQRAKMEISKSDYRKYIDTRKHEKENKDAEN